MKYRSVFLFSAMILAVSSVTPIAGPLATLTFRSYGDVTNAISKVALTVDPASKKDVGAELSKALGLVNSTAYDVRGPWELSVWYDGSGGQPWLALKAPANDLNRFKESLNSEGTLRKQGKTWSEAGKGVAVITFRETGALSTEEKTALDQWKAQALRPPAGILGLTLAMTEPVRAQLTGMMGIAKMSMSSIVSSQPPGSLGGADPKAMSELFSLYLDVLNNFIAGFQETRLGLDLNADTILVDKVVTAQPGSELAKWLERPAGHVTEQDLKGLDPETYVSAAAYLGKSPAVLEFMRRATLLGFQMQNVDTNDPAIKDIEGLMEKMLPMVFTGSVYLQDRIGFAGAYRFPASSAAEICSQLKSFVNGSMRHFVGADKMYSAASLVEKSQTIAGSSVDRLSMTLNTNSPLFNMPGQREQLQKIWPDGKMEIDYAVKDGQLWMASADRMKNLLDPGAAKPGQKTAFKLEEGTCLAGYLNFIYVIKQLLSTNPMIPGPMKEKMSQLNPQGAGITFELSLNNRLHANSRIPLRLLSELGRLKDK